jgi:hypothetical protein
LFKSGIKFVIFKITFYPYLIYNLICTSRPKHKTTRTISSNLFFDSNYIFKPKNTFSKSFLCKQKTKLIVSLLQLGMCTSLFVCNLNFEIGLDICIVSVDWFAKKYNFLKTILCFVSIYRSGLCIL